MALGTTYDYYVRAVCATDNVSEFIGPESFTTLTCDKITNVEVFDIAATSAVVQFSPNASETYEIEYGATGFTPGTGTVVFEQFGNQTEITGLTASTTYDVYVRTVCGETFSEYSDVVTFTTDSTCITPTNLFVFFVSSNFVDFGWDSNGETAFLVEYGESGFTLGTGQEAGTSNTSIVIDNLQSGTTYEFYVRANCGSEGFSNYSEVLVVTTNP